jgi:hypothetical protein
MTKQPNQQQLNNLLAAQERAEAHARYIAFHLNQKEFTGYGQDCAVTVNGLGVVTAIATPDAGLSARLHQAWTVAYALAKDHATKMTNGKFPDPPKPPASN